MSLRKKDLRPGSASLRRSTILERWPLLALRDLGQLRLIDYSFTTMPSRLFRMMAKAELQKPSNQITHEKSLGEKDNYIRRFTSNMYIAGDEQRGDMGGHTR